MNKFFTNWWFLVLLSSVLFFFNICKIEFLFAWICFIPLFIAIKDGSPKKSCKAGFIFGAAFSIPAFFWMIPGAESFTGNSSIYGFAAWLVSAIFFSLFYGLILYIFSLLKIRKQKISLVVNSFLIASLFVIAESLLTLVSLNFPWFAAYSGNGLAANIYSIQPVAVFGISILSFIVVFVNHLFACYIQRRQWKKLYLPVGIIALYLVSGVIMFQNFRSNSFSNKPFNVAILAENIPPEMKWNETTGNILVNRLLDLNRIAVALQPDIVLWSESAIPWTYKKDDDLVKEIVAITASKQITHILGINTEYKDNIVFNSAYAILPTGDVTSRYDKQYLLAIIEKPFNGFLMPFFSSSGFSVANDEIHAAPLTTPFGKAGILICNETAIPAAAAKSVNKGAEFLFNMSNDGWFSDTYIVRLHFYLARLRAVESRKDLVVNCNNGYSGLIKASGEIVEKEKSEDPFVKMVSVQPNNIKTTATTFPGLLIYCCAIYLAFVAVFKIIHESTSGRNNGNSLL